MRADKVVVYVEGPSDKSAMDILMAGIMKQAENKGTKIELSFLKGKGPLMNKGPKRAANDLIKKPNYHVVIMPDLYPANEGGEHETVEEMKELLKGKFNGILKERRVKDPESISSRFHVHCFKHDLEALLLASEEELLDYLGTKETKIKWNEDVEEQDFTDYPKKIVKQLFEESGRNYRPTVDVPEILSKVNDLEKLMKRCPQCFAPFVKFLESFAE